MPKTPATLSALKRAAARRQAAEEAYRAAIFAAIEQRFGYVEVARAAGTSRQAVRQLVLRQQGQR